MGNYDKNVQDAVTLPSAKDLNGQIRALENDIITLRISGSLDDATLSELEHQLNSLKATITTINFSPDALSNLSKQVAKALGSASPSKESSPSWINSLKKASEEITSVKNIGKRRISVRISDNILF